MALEQDHLTYSLCVPVMGRDGAMGLLSVYGRGESESDASEQHKSTLFNNKTKNVEVKKIKLILTDIADRFGTAVSNINLRKKLHLESTVDPLTKLYNRRYFEEASELEIRRSLRSRRSLCVLMIDADHFKSFNDEYGHDVGDYVLVSIAKLIGTHIRSEDVPARLGGEEFAILFGSTGINNAMKIAEEIRVDVEKYELIFHDKKLRKITISAGIASIPEHAQNLSECLALADKALYQAKQNGRNQVVIYSPKSR
ncbi:MAG: GGDEF domain-containing protein [Gammaproteobacteria bacterium]|nr:GGDEF domain-containing protein [Gammaproteobacteria bacterium]